MDCTETTILMRLRQFQHEHLFDLGADLDKYRTAKYVENVWWSFHQEFDDMPHKEGEKKVGKIKSEKDLTRKWVRGCGAWLCRRQQTANLSFGVVHRPRSTARTTCASATFFTCPRTSPTSPTFTSTRSTDRSFQTATGS